MEQSSKYTESVDFSASIGDGSVQCLTFNPSKNFSEGNTTLFGITARQQGRNLVIVTKIYKEKRRHEIIGKMGIVTNVIIGLMSNSRNKLDKVYVVDQKDVLEQISKHKMIDKKLVESVTLTDFTKEKCVTIDVIDIVTGEMVPIGLSVKLLKI